MRKRSKAELRRTAVHEAGHAVAAFKVGMRTKALSIVADGESLGHHRPHPYFAGVNPELDGSPRVQRRLENAALVYLAGAAAERRFSPKGFRHAGSSGDRHQAIELLSYLTGSNEELEAYLRLVDVRARQLVADPLNWFLINGLAARLLERQELTGDEVLRAIRAAYDEDFKRRLASIAGRPRKASARTARAAPRRVRKPTRDAKRR